MVYFFASPTSMSETTKTSLLIDSMKKLQECVVNIIKHKKKFSLS